jgi:hypothetical protein
MQPVCRLRSIFRHTLLMILFAVPVFGSGSATRLISEPIAAPISEPTTTVSGVVIDAATDEGLYAATVQIEGTYQGTITNTDGEFSIRISEYPVTLIFRFIGYQTQYMYLESRPENPLQILMQPTLVNLSEIVVTGDDPALRIMREVIERKKIWRDELDTYVADAYTRQRLENETGIVSINESTSRAYWDRRRGTREVLLHREQTSNVDASQNFAGATLVPNFYDDDIPISGFQMVGVTHPDALRFYHFKLEGFRELDGRTVYDISVTPRRPLQPTFVGRIAVLGEVYALLEVDLKPGDSVMFPPPIQEFGLWYRQQFSNFGGDFWLPVDVRIEGTIRLGFPGLQFPTINFFQMSRLSDYQVNIALPDTLFDISRRIIRPLELPTDTTRISLQRHIPLDERESEAYQTLDSTQTLDKAFQPTGALSRFVNMDDGDENNRRGNNGPLGRALSGFEPAAGYNRVDGGRIGLNYSRTFLDGRLRPSAGASYQTGSEKWDYRFGLRYDLLLPVDRRRVAAAAQAGRRRPGTRPLRVEATYSAETTSVFSESQVPGMISSGVMLLGGADYFDYYRTTGFQADVSRRLRRTNLRWSAGFAQTDYQSLQTVTNYSILGGKIQRLNPTTDEGMGRYLKAGFTWGGEPAPFGVTGGNNAEVTITHSTDLIGSDFEFTRFYGRLDWRFETFYRRRFMPNTLDLRLVAGTHVGDLPPQHLHGLDSAPGYFTPFGGFRTAGNLPLTGTHTLGLFWEHNFRSVPFEMIGITGAAKRGIGIIVHGAHGHVRGNRNPVFPPIAWLAGGDLAPIPAPEPLFNRNHHEMGVSLNGLFSVLRIDAAWRLDRPGSYIGFSVARIF